MSEFEIKKKVTEAVTQRIIQESSPPSQQLEGTGAQKGAKPRPGISEIRVRQIIAEEMANIKIPEVSGKAHDVLLLLLAQCRTLAGYKAGHAGKSGKANANIRPWMKQFRENINAAEEVLGLSLTDFLKTPKEAEPDAPDH